MKFFTENLVKDEEKDYSIVMHNNAYGNDITSKCK